MKRRKGINTTLAFGLLLGTAINALGQQQMLPVYNVVQSGATAAQAASLAARLNIPASQLVVSNGVVSFLDFDNFLPVPTKPVTDQGAIDTLLAGTDNHYPSIPIRFEQIDFDSLAAMSILDDATAVQLAAGALNGAGLGSPYGAPVIHHATLSASYDDGGLSRSADRSLDTQVHYAFRDTNGYPFVGPGAQVQLAFGPNGQVSRLLYAARQMVPGPLVPILPPNVASNRFAGMFPAGTSFSMDVEYICPPFWWERFHPCPCPPPPPWQIDTILPYYVAHATTQVIDPSGRVTQVRNLEQSIPATMDERFVPTVNLNASSQGAGVSASAFVTGGRAPYTFVWSGSPGDLGTNDGPSVSYSPVVRAAPPTLRIRPFSLPGHNGYMYAVQWNGMSESAAGPHPMPWVLESTTDLSSPNRWTPFTNSVPNSNGVYEVTIDSPAPHMYFRLRLGNPTVPVNETVSLTVIDANGVTVQTSQTIAASAVALWPIALGPGLCYGTESSVDPGLGTADRASWTAAMATPGGGAGYQRFLWTAQTTWLGDFIEPPVPHTLPPNPQINGCDDYLNWGVDCANIVLYIGHGNPDVITFTPTPPLFWWNPDLPGSWGNDVLNWLCFLSCDVLEKTNSTGVTATARWGRGFDGLHILTGFHTLAWAGTGFTGGFAKTMLGIGEPKQTIVKSWVNNALGHGTGGPAALGPIGPGGSWDYNDYYWGKGAVGPTISAPQIKGWWYLSL